MIQTVLQASLKAMCGLSKKALDFNDPEGVHDMRVYSRRLRSALSDFKPYLRKCNLLERELKAIARALGAVRDEDVALLALKELKTKATGAAAEGIELIAQESERRQSEARTALQDTLRPLAITELRKEFLTRLESVTLGRRWQPSRTDATEQVFSFAALGVEVIKTRLEEFIEASADIYSPFEIKDLHELRILAKRLRYSIMVFAVCWGAEMEGIAKEIGSLQTSLGEMHDCDVWIENVSARLRKARSQRSHAEENAPLIDGAAWLLRHFVKVRMEHYRDALDRWQEWEASGFLVNLKAMLFQVPAEEPATKLTSTELIESDQLLNG